jgi:formamidopyrimidine-DNA glycosylase
MPELPEVETIAAVLRQGRDGTPSLIGKRIQGARLLWERTLALPTPQVFQARIKGQMVQEIDRRGKFLLLHLSQDVLLIHLRMSGDLWVEAAEAPLAPHHRLVLDFQDGSRLAFNDARKFGRVWLTASPDEVVGHLGPEPFDPQLTQPVFYQMLLAHRRQLKPLLLDQSFLAGLGNIYTDEALNLAKLHPLTLSQSLSPDQAGCLLESIREVLAEGIRRNGASIDWVYRGGDFQNYFRVYQRTGQPCPVCQTPIQRMVVGQRGTHFCPHCQPPPV